jgi:Zn-dependent protease
MLSGQWWVHSYIQDGQVVLLVSWIFWVIFSICMHELAHGWAALWQGDDTPRQLDRMTMNPLVHMGGMSLLVFALIGIAWGVMPVDPSRFRNRRWGDVLVSAAGPAMNVALAVVALTAAGVWEQYGDSIANEGLYENVTDFLFVGGMLNIVLAAFNLLPIPPLDGSRIASGFSYKARQFFESPQSQMFGLFVLLAIFITGSFSMIFAVAAGLSNGFIDVVLHVLP